MSQNNHYRPYVLILSLVFLMWGLLTSLNGLLVLQVQDIFTMSLEKALFIKFGVFISYGIMSVPAGKIIDKIGFRSGLILGLVISGFACTLFGPAATGRSFGLFATAILTLGAGFSMLQVAANTYVCLLSNSDDSTANLNKKQAFNSLGSIIALLFGLSFFYMLTNIQEGELAMMDPENIRMAKAILVQNPYVILSTIMFGLALYLTFSKVPKIHSNEVEPNVKGWQNFKFMFQFPQVKYGFFAVLFYVGAEVSIISNIPGLLLSLQVDAIQSLQDAYFYVATVFLGGMMIGRFIGSFLLKSMDIGRMLAYAAIASITLILISSFTSGTISMYAILLVGLFNSIQFPTIFSLGIEGLGRSSEEGGSVLITGIFGGALIPFIIAQLILPMGGLQYALLLTIICFAYIAWYGWKGHLFEKIDPNWKYILPEIKDDDME